MFRRPLNAAEQKIAEANMRLVSHFANRYASAFNLSRKELIQEGSIGLFAAVQKFDPSHGVTFSTYASRWIRQVLLNYCHKFLAHGTTPGIRSTADYEERAKVYYIDENPEDIDDSDQCGINGIIDDSLEEPAVIIERQEIINKVRNIVRSLPARKRKAILLWLRGYDGAEIERMTGIARQSTQQYLAKLVIKASEKLSKESAGKFLFCKKCRRAKKAANMVGGVCRPCKK